MQRRSSWAEFLGRMAHHTTSRPSHITSRKKRTQRRSSWAEFLGRMAFSTPSHITSRKKRTLDTITHHKPKEENTKKKFLGRVLGPDVCVSTLCVSTMCEHSMCVSTLTISHITSRKKRTQRRSSWAEFLGQMAHHTTSHHHT